MPRRRIPSHRCDKPKNLGLVALDGKQHDLGKYDAPESVAGYNRLVQEWLTRGPPQAAFLHLWDQEYKSNLTLKIDVGGKPLFKMTVKTEKTLFQAPMP